MPTLYLIDGHSLIFRMYYAFMRTPMVNSKGQDTSILFGFTKFILDLIKNEHPDNIAIAFDPPAKTFRHEMYPEYKANRSAAPELVKEALEPLTEIAESLGIPVIMMPGYEADDVIGSMAKQYASKGYKVFMVTPDKDLGQIISENIYQYKPGKGKDEKSIVGVKEICDQYGITNPLQVIDILTLWGDSADNVKGVPGVGEVSAKKLVGKYGSVNNIYSHLADLTPKMQEAFNQAEEYINMSKALVTIKTDIALDINDENLKNSVTFTKAFADIVAKYEMPSLKNHFSSAETVESGQDHPKNSVKLNEIDSKTLVNEALAKNFICFRLDGNRIVFSTGDNYCILDIGDKLTAELLSNANLLKIGHNIKTSITELGKQGIAVNGKFADIEIMHYLLNPERTHRLDFLASGYLDIDISAPQERVAAQSQTLDLFSAPIENQNNTDSINLAIREASILYSVYRKVREELESQNMLSLYDNIEEPLIKVLAQMELDGVKIDPFQLQEYSKSLSDELSVIEHDAREMVNEPELNLASPRQVGTVIFEKLALNPKIKKKGLNYPTDEETLNDLTDKHPFVGKVLEYRAVRKLLSTYIDPLPALINPLTGKIHTTFNQALTATGRLSSVKPNLQNIPIRTDRGREIRKAFVASNPDGYIVSADYSQIELRLMAELSGDESLLEGFRHGADIHAATAAKIFKHNPEDVTKEERRRAKTANFGIIYGISAFGLSQRLGISRTEAKKLIEDYFANYPKVKEYMDSSIDKAKSSGFVQTIFGRKRFLPDINSRNQTVRGLAERNAINAPIQGSAADIIKLAMINVARRMKDEGIRSKMVLQVHDELIFDTLPDELDRLMTIIKEEMEGVCKLSVPLTVECSYGKNWLEAH